MRIIAGKLKKTILYIPQNKLTRPLKDRARESIFDLLTQNSSIFWSKSKLLRRNLTDFDSSSTAVDGNTDCVVQLATPEHHSVIVKTGTSTAE